MNMHNLQRRSQPCTQPALRGRTRVRQIALISSYLRDTSSYKRIPLGKTFTTLILCLNQELQQQFDTRLSHSNPYYFSTEGIHNCQNQISTLSYRGGIHTIRGVMQFNIKTPRYVFSPGIDHYSLESS